MEYSAHASAASSNHARLYLLTMMKLFLFLLLACGAAVADDTAIMKCRTLGDSKLRLACYDAMVLGTSGAQAVPAAAPTRQAMEQSFGLAEKKAPLASIESTIPGSFDGWGPNEQITLSNGQVWRVVDDTNGVVYGTNLKVKLERSPFGTTFMVIEGTTRSPKVKRLK